MPFSFTTPSFERLQRLQQRAQPSLVALVLAATSSCGWVDSTGVNQTGSANADFGAAPATDATIVQTTDIEEVRVIQLLENNSVRIVPNEPPGNVIDWSWTAAIRNEATPDCRNVNGFDTRLAANELATACTSTRDCELSIQNTTDENGRRAFDFAISSLKQPVGLSYRLTALDSDGSVTNEYYSICGISINEAPIAEDDSFTVIRGETRTIRADDTINLLSNDTDDIDIRNRPLSVIPTPVTEPQQAIIFRLESNGGFTYTAPADSNASGTEFDRFSYQVTDGTHTSEATATIRIVSVNGEPELLSDIPDMAVTAGFNIDSDDADFNVSRFFSDPDNDSLIFTALEGSFPASGNLTLSRDGQITGQATADDVGDYVVTLTVSDGRAEISSTFIFSVVADLTIDETEPPDESSPDGSSPDESSPDEADDSSAADPSPVIETPEIGSYDRGDQIRISIAAADPEGERLLYSLSDDTADFLSINRNTGRISGTAPDAGTYPVTVIVSNGESSSTLTFDLSITDLNNQAPIVDDIANAQFDDTFLYDISIFFEDPDGDEMSFTSLSLPPDVSLTETGLLSGEPTADNLGPHFILVTASDGRGGEVTDGFLLSLQ